MSQNLKVINYRGFVTIYYSANGKNLRLSTGVKTSDAEIVKKSGELKVSFINKNPVLISKIKYVDDFITEYLIDNRVKPSISLVRSKIEQDRQVDIKKNLPLLDYFSLFFDEKKNEFSNKDKSLSSLKDYKSFWNSLIDFENYSRTTLYIGDIDNKQLEKYKYFMFQEHNSTDDIKYITKGNLNQNTFRKRLITLKSFFHWLNKSKIIKEIPIDISEFKVDKKETYKEVLTSNEILSLYKMTFEPKWLNQIKDAFVFACHTGMRYSDLISISRVNSKKKNDSFFIRKRAEKVNEYFMVPLTDIAYEIAVKYNFNFKIATNQIFNRALKEVLQKSELFNEETEVLNRNNVPFKRYELAHAHSARHSFITNLVNERVAISEIMSMTGHKKLDTLNAYIKKKEPESNETLNNVFGKK